MRDAGLPSARTVDRDIGWGMGSDDGFASSYQSRNKAEGAGERAPPEESAAYFAGRPRGAQIGAWASDQSRVLPFGETLEARVREIEARHQGGPVPRPPHWGGYRVIPRAFEFWTGRENRLHDRFRSDRTSGGWATTQLYP